MKFFLDTANLDEIRETADLGILDGVTTNPSLISEEDIEFEEAIEEISEILPDGVVNAEVVSTNTEGMLEEARQLSSIAENVIVKIPLIPDGIRAVSRLSDEGIRTNVTLCFSANQAIFAAKAGATFISPFVGRIDDRGHQGMEVVKDIRTIYDNYKFDTEILTASVRHPDHVLQAARVGSDIVTMPYEVFHKLLQHPLTDQGLERFLSDWNAAQEEEDQEEPVESVTKK